MYGRTGTERCACVTSSVPASVSVADKAAFLEASEGITEALIVDGEACSDLGAAERFGCAVKELDDAVLERLRLAAAVRLYDTQVWRMLVEIDVEWLDS